MENRFSQFIVDHTKYLVYQMRGVVEILLKPEGADGQAEFNPDEMALVGDDLERFAPQWKYMVPDDPTTCAIIAHDFFSTYELVYDRATQLRTALHLNSDAVQQAYETRYGESIEEAMSDREQTIPRRVSRLSWIDEMTAYRIERELEWVSLRPGEKLFASDTLYAVVSGQIKLVEDEVGEDEVVSYVGRGAIVGERGILGGDDFLATITAVRHSHLVKLSRAAFYKLNSNHPQIMMGFIKTLMNRVSRPSLPAIQAVAVLPVHESIQIDRFFDYLKRELDTCGDVLHLSAAQLDEQLFVGASQTPANETLVQPVVAWLSERETLHDLVVYELTTDDPDWARQAIQHVDRIVLVADAEESYEVTEIEKELLTGTPVSTDLVLLHRDKETLPSGTRHWLERRKIEFHHHVAMHTVNDARRIAHRLMGLSIGLVPGAGITRAYAHCGVIQALNEPGFAVDRIAATSFACIPAAMLAMNEDHKTCRAALDRVFAALDARTLPVTSLVSGKALSKVLKDLFGDTRLEDLWIPLTCVSFDATHATQHFHERGLLWEAIRASLSIPGLLPAVVQDSTTLLVDGSMINPMPVDVVRQNINGAVIAVDCGVIEETHPEFDAVDNVSGWQLFLNRINPLVSDKIEAPDIVKLMSRMATVAGRGQSIRQLAQADIPVRLPLEDFGFYDGDNRQKLEEIGYRVMRDVMAQWLAEHPEYTGAVRI